MRVSQQDIEAALTFLEGHPRHPGVELSIPGNILEGMRELGRQGLVDWHHDRGYKLTHEGRLQARAILAAAAK